MDQDFFSKESLFHHGHGRFEETEGRHGGPQNSDNNYTASVNPLLQEEHQVDGAKVHSGR